MEITHRFTGAILYTSETATSVKELLIEAIGQSADLQGANLRGANLRGANLQGAYLRDANLRGANLQSANLQGANLRDAHLLGANLQSANLRGANLRGADLQSANLRGANLRGAYLLSCGERLDGYAFYAQLKDDELWIIAGCRYFTHVDAVKHWQNTRGGTQLGNESQQLVSNAVSIATIRGWIK